MYKIPPIVGHGNGGIVDNSKIFDRSRPWSIIDGIFLRHWEQENTLQFVTMHLADSLPQEKLQDFIQIRSEFLNSHPRPWDDRIFYMFKCLYNNNINKWLEQGYGECILSRKSAAETVKSALHFHDGRNIELHDYVIMPNHIHFLASASQCTMYSVVNSIKSYTASEISKIYKRTGRIWQRDYFDRLIRSVSDYIEKAEYIRHNPLGK